MNERARKILFLSFLIIFLVAAPTLILYFQGYRIDFTNKKLTQTGGLFLKVIPKQVEVYLDGKLVKKTDFLFGSVFIEDLLPGKYQIDVKKTGFLSWSKSLEIKEKEVTKVWTIILFPEKSGFNLLEKSVGDIWFSPDGKKIVLYEKTDDGWALKLYDLEKNLKSRLIEDEDIDPAGADLMKLEFSSDSKTAFLEVGVKENLKYFTLDLEKVPPRLAESENNQPEEENAIALQTEGKDVYLLDKVGNLFKSGEKISEKPFPVKAETEYKLDVFSGYVFLNESGNLFLFNTESESFEKFFDNVKSLKISPNSQKLLYFSDWEIWIMFLSDKLDQPLKKAGEKEFLVRLSEKIQEVSWLESDYLVFNTGDKIKIIEIDNRDRINTIDIAEFKNPEIFWNQTDKKLYVLTEETLYASEKLLK